MSNFLPTTKKIFKDNYPVVAYLDERITQDMPFDELNHLTKSAKIVVAKLKDPKLLDIPVECTQKCATEALLLSAEELFNAARAYDNWGVKYSIFNAVQTKESLKSDGLPLLLPYLLELTSGVNARRIVKSLNEVDIDTEEEVLYFLEEFTPYLTQIKGLKTTNICILVAAVSNAIMTIIEAGDFVNLNENTNSKDVDQVLNIIKTTDDPFEGGFFRSIINFFQRLFSR